MKKHVMGMTYQPKIDAVFNGACFQTIRQGLKISVGDEILFYTWTGRPYRSKWDKRLRVVVREIIDLVVDWDRGIIVNGTAWDWNSPAVELLAETDHIAPATGIELRNVLCGLVSEKRFEAQIIRW